MSSTAFSNRLSEQPGDLKACENEPLQFIGSVQSFGALIAFTLNDGRIQAASLNVEQVLSQGHSNVVSSKLNFVVGEANEAAIIAACRELGAASPRINVALQIGDMQFDGTVFATENLHFLELEAVDAETTQKRFQQEDEVKRCLIELRRGKKLENLAMSVCRSIQKIVGIDRVMMYRFLAPHMHGEVIAEHRVLSSHSYLQHRFPASDIPRIARDLYLRNGVRVIPDINAPTSPVKPALNPLTGSDLDLSDSRLRAVSPIHLEYLRNMRIGCSFSVAVVVDGKLWGLIACHHSAALRISVSKRNACEIIANGFASLAGLVEMTEVQSRRILFDKKVRDLLDSVVISRDPIDQLMKRHQLLLEAFGATGAALVRGTSCDLVGLCPPRDQVLQLRQALSERMEARHVDMVSFDSLSDELGDSGISVHLAAGVMATKVGEDGVFMIFRPEQVETIIWGGDPRKQLERKAFEGRINPRTSFEAWEETIKGVSVPWNDFEREGFRHLLSLVFERLAARRF